MLITYCELCQLDIIISLRHCRYIAQVTKRKFSIKTTLERKTHRHRAGQSPQFRKTDRRTERQADIQTGLREEGLIFRNDVYHRNELKAQICL